MQPGAPGAIRTAVTKGTTGAVKESSGGAADKGTNLNTNPNPNSEAGACTLTLTLTTY